MYVRAHTLTLTTETKRAQVEVVEALDGFAKADCGAAEQRPSLPCFAVKNLFCWLLFLFFLPCCLPACLAPFLLFLVFVRLLLLLLLCACVCVCVFWACFVSSWVEETKKARKHKASSTAMEKKHGFGKRRRAVINRNSKPKPIARQQDAPSKMGVALRSAGRALLKRASAIAEEAKNEEDGGGPANNGVPDIASVAEKALKLLSKHQTDADVWRDHTSKVYDGHEGRDQYWTMFRTGRRMEYGKRAHKPRDSADLDAMLNGEDMEDNNAEDAPLSPRSAYLKKMEEFNLRPERIQFDKEKTELAIHSYGLGDKRIEALAMSLSHFPYELVNLSNNRMTATGLEHVVRNLSDGCFSLDVSQNNLGADGAQHVVSYILQPGPLCVQHELMTLNLASCKLGNAGAEALGEGLSSANKFLKRLTVSNNDIEEEACMKLVMGLMNCEVLEELDISWNNIDLAAAALIRQLKTLQWLDLSSNSLGSQSAQDQTAGFLASEQASDGSGGSLAMITRIGNAILENETLIHLSLSNNQFDMQQLQVLSKLLEGNHTLIGLHLSHANARVDAHGFLRVTGGGGVPDDNDGENADNGADQEASILGTDGSAHGSHTSASVHGTREAGDKLRPSEWLKMAPMRERREAFKYKSCWICGGYSEKRFKVVIQKNAEGNLSKRAINNGVYVPESVLLQMLKSVPRVGVRVHQHGMAVLKCRCKRQSCC